MARQGIWRFLAVGDGCYPLVHETLREFGSDQYRIAYVGHGTRPALRPAVISIACDAADAHLITSDPAVLELMRDDDRPIGVIAVSILEQLTVLDEARKFVATVMEWAPEGSYLAACHALSDGTPHEIKLAAAEDSAINFRTLRQISRLFDGLVVLTPGIREVSQWRISGRARSDPPLLKRVGVLARKGRQRSGIHAVFAAAIQSRAPEAGAHRCGPDLGDQTAG